MHGHWTLLQLRVTICTVEGRHCLHCYTAYQHVVACGIPEEHKTVCAWRIAAMTWIPVDLTCCVGLAPSSPAVQ